MNRAITDTQSKDITMNDPQVAFKGVLGPVRPSYQDCISYIGERSQERSLARWRLYLQDIEPCRFPRFEGGCQETKKIMIEVPAIDTFQLRRFCAETEIMPATVVQLAWAMVLGLYTGSSCPVFGVLTLGQDVPIDRANNMFGPSAGVFPSKVTQTPDAPARVLLEDLQKDHLLALSHQAVSLAKIHNMLGLGSSSLFNSVVTLQKVAKNVTQKSSALNVEGLGVKGLGGKDPTDYDMWIQGLDGDEAFQVIIISRSDFLGSHGPRVASSLSKALSAITTNAAVSLSGLDILPDQDRHCIWAWNSALPEAANTSVYGLVEERIREGPGRPAIDAWDGKLTYGELDSESRSLSVKLLESGAQRGSIVPIYSDKSRWAIVALVAVMKIGATFVLLDTALPAQRLQSMLDKIGSSILLASERTLSRAQSMAEQIVLLGPTLSSSGSAPPQQTPAIDPASSLYAVFTSGSTGEPKGVLVSNRSFASAILHQARRMGFRPSSRVFDFASYAFDVSISNILFTLAAGACLCIPSDDDRKSRLAQSINSFDANLIELTPSVSRLVDPREVRGVKTLILGGEKVMPSDVSRWPDYVRAINTYGPAECTPTSTIFSLGDNQSSADVVIGKGAGAVAWVVDPANDQRLTPVGVPGELLIEGPIVDGNCYLSNPQAMEKAFVSDPGWLTRGDGQRYPGRRGRLYKTGDLVCYNKDGELHFLGRKDQQIKIHGQRVELSEIEHQVLQCFTDAMEAAVDVITPSGAADNQQLAAFVVLRASSEEESHYATPRLIRIPGPTEKRLSEALPGYMCPSVFIAVESLPLSVSGKTDRRQLKQIGSSFTSRQIHDLSNTLVVAKQGPTNYSEIALQNLWANLLNLDVASIGIHDHFFKLGGNSMTAMRLVDEARRRGFELSVADVLHHPTLQDQARRLSVLSDKTMADVPPFGLIEGQERLLSDYKGYAIQQAQ